MSNFKLAFIGFGEAASHFAIGLIESGLTDIAAYSHASRHVDGVTFCDDVGATIKGRDLVISAVTAGAALNVAEEISKHVNESQIVMDVNSVSPGTKRDIATMINGVGGRFVEAAIMGSLPKYGHKVPMLVGGPEAPEVVEMLAPYGMDLTDLGPAYGRAAATKMFRSIMVKGLEALLQECVLGADKYGAADQVLASVGDGYPGIDWAKLADNLIGRTAIHGARRADEMDQVANTLRELGIDPFMASAAAKRIRWATDQGLKDTFGDKAPESFHDVLSALKQK